MFPEDRRDIAGVALCVVLMSVSGLFYIIGGQFVASKLWHWVPISGYAGGAVLVVGAAAGPEIEKFAGGLGVESGLGIGTSRSAAVRGGVDAARTAADDGDSRHTGFFERHVIATGEESIEIKFVAEPGGLACFGRHGFL